MIGQRDCPGCVEASKDARTPYFGSIAGADSCPECKARSLAQSPAFFDSGRAGTMTPAYRAALRYCFPNEPLAEAHERVKQWAKRIAEAA